MRNFSNNIWASFIFFLLMSSIGCGDRSHKKEARLLEKERMEAEKAASDLSIAVKITDEAGWNGRGIYSEFKAKALMELADDKNKLNTFTVKIKGKKKRTPLLYRSRIRSIQRQIINLESSINHYKLTDKAHWQDFVLLFNDDKKRMEHALYQLMNR